MVFYGIQIFENLISMKFRFWKDNFNAFHLLEKVIFMVFSLHFRVFCMLGHQIQNSFDGWKLTELSEVLYEVIAFTDDNNVQWYTLQEDYFLFN